MRPKAESINPKQIAAADDGRPALCNKSRKFAVGSWVQLYKPMFIDFPPFNRKWLIIDQVQKIVMKSLKIRAIRPKLIEHQVSGKPVNGDEAVRIFGPIRRGGHE
jgi:hypothetical protein